jgi:hypothetical protein
LLNYVSQMFESSGYNNGCAEVLLTD